MKRYGLALLVVATLAAPLRADTVIVDDNFESYADQAAFKATWMPTVGNGGALANAADEDAGYLVGCPTCAPITDPVNYPGIQGQAVDHIGATASTPGQVNQYDDDNDLNTLPFQIAPSSTQKVVLSADIFVGSSGNERMTVGLRSRSPAANLIEMGAYNANTCDPTQPTCTDPAGVNNPPASDPSFIPSKGYAYRVVLFSGFGGDLLVNPNWQYFELPQDLDRIDDTDEFVSIGDIGAGWHTYTVEIGETELTFSLDLFRDGFVNTRDQDGIIVPSTTPGPDASQTWQITTNLTAGFNSLRMGGPSGLLSAGPGFMAFDNLLLQLVDNVAPGLLGDFNEDGTVDAADYVVWRKNEVPNAPLPNDDGLATQAERYDLWTAHFGEQGSASGATLQSAAVPEPTTIVLLLGTLAALAMGHRR